MRLPTSSQVPNNYDATITVTYKKKVRPMYQIERLKSPTTYETPFFANTPGVEPHALMIDTGAAAAGAGAGAALSCYEARAADKRPEHAGW